MGLSRSLSLIWLLQQWDKADDLLWNLPALIDKPWLMLCPGSGNHGIAEAGRAPRMVEPSAEPAHGVSPVPLPTAASISLPSTPGSSAGQEGSQPPSVGTVGSVWGQLVPGELLQQLCHHPGRSWHRKHRGVSWGGQTRKSEIKVFVLPTWSRYRNGTGTEKPSQPEGPAVLG